MSGIALVVIGALAALVVVIVAIPKLFGRTARLRRRIGAARHVAIRDLAGPAACRVAGMVAAVGEPLIAPLSGRACVYYETRVIRIVGLDPSALSHEWEVAAETRAVMFSVDDGTGCVVVDASDAVTLLGTDVDRWAGDDDGDVAAEDAFLARFGQRRHGFLFAKRLHFIESVIEVGERIAVVAAATRAQPQLGGRVAITDDPAFAPPLDDA